MTNQKGRGRKRKYRDAREPRHKRQRCNDHNADGESECQDDVFEMDNEENYKAHWKWMMNADDCIEWLKSVDFGQYTTLLRSQWEDDEMDGKTLRLLTEDNLVCDSSLFSLCNCDVNLFCAF